MKKGLILIGIIVLTFIVGYVALSFNAVKFLIAKVEKMEKRGLIISEIQARPTHLKAKNIQYKDPLTGQPIFQIEEMKIYPGLFSPLTKTFTIRNCTVVNPILFFTRSQEGAFNGPWIPIEKEEKGEEISKGRAEKGKERVSIKIVRLHIEKGIVHFEDRKMGGNPAKIELKELDLEIKNIRYPMVSVHSPIELKGKLKGQTEEQNIDLKGWVNFKTMDMETLFKAQEIEIKTFEPYYRKRVSAEIESGYATIEATIAVKNKTMDVPGHLELIGLRIQGEGTIFWIPAKTLAALLKAKGDRMKVSFHIKGNLDDPRFDLQEAVLTRMAIAFLEGLGFPVKIVGEKFLEGAGREREGWAEGLKSLRDMFKKNKEKKR